MLFFASGVNLQKIPARANAPGGWKALETHRLGSQPLATLLPAAPDDSATARSSHARQKTMPARAAHLAWLIGSFHFQFLL